jgi:hypothetical protein
MIRDSATGPVVDSLRRHRRSLGRDVDGANADR